MLALLKEKRDAFKDAQVKWRCEVE
jgi:hypothetical protein